MSTDDLEKQLLSRLRAFPSPPRGFDPRKASDKILEKHGFPHRPDPKAQPIAHAVWDRVLSRPLKIVKPTFEIVDAPRRARPRRPNQKDMDWSTSNWSGAVSMPASGAKFTMIAASWIVPSVVVPPTGAALPPATYTASVWVGIDDSDLLQAGTACQIDVGADGVPQPTYFAWFEWLPYNYVKLPSIPVGPGDEIHVAIIGSNTTGSVYFANLTRNTATSFSVDPPPGTSLLGNYAEWILERYAGDLADFRAVFFHDVVAFEATGTGATFRKTEVQPSAASSTPVRMTDALGHTATGAFGDGFVEVYYGTQTPRPRPSPPTRRDRLSAGQGLRTGQSLVSDDGRFKLLLQLDGNLVIYDPAARPLWASNTAARPEVSDAFMQGDGNLVVYDIAGRPLWASNTWGHPGAWLNMQDDGNLVVYDSGNRPLWASDTVQS